MTAPHVYYWHGDRHEVEHDSFYCRGCDAFCERTHLFDPDAHPEHRGYAGLRQRSKDSWKAYRAVGENIRRAVPLVAAHEGARAYSTSDSTD